jgi:hypothetical protein
MRRAAKFVFSMALAILLAFAAEPAFAQRGRGQGQPAKTPKRDAAAERRQQRLQQQQREGQKAADQNAAKSGEAPPESNAGRGQGNPFRPGLGPGAGRGGPGAGAPPKFLQQLREMTPEEQERTLQDNPRFQRLGPEGQEEIRNSLREWNSLTPVQKEERKRREARLEALTPEERRDIRQRIFPNWQRLERWRKMGIVRRLNSLQGMTDEERERRLNDAAFTQGLSGEELEILKTFSRLGLGPAANPRGDRQGPPL